MESKKRMQIIAENITKYRKERGITQKELSEAIGISSSAMTEYMKLRTAPSYGVIQKIADYFGVKKSDIDSTFRPKNEPVSETKRILDNIFEKLNAPHQKKVLNYAQHELKIQQATDNKIMELAEYRTDKEYDYYDHATSAGTGQYLASMEKERITLPVDYDADFVVPVYGDSMEPVYHSGDYIFVEQTFNLNDGDIGVFELNGSAFIKELYIDGNEICLHSLNPEYKDIPITPDCEFRIIGKVVGRYNEKYNNKN